MGFQAVFANGDNVPWKTGKAVCVGRNFVEHVAELNNALTSEPLLFIKPASALVTTQPELHLPHRLGLIHFEAEIIVLIGRQLTHESRDDAILKAMAGYAPGLDLTLRDLQSQLKKDGLPWEKSKAFDGSGVVAPFYLPQDLNPEDLEIILSINDVVRQKGHSNQMITPIFDLIKQVLVFFSLQPGDLIFTGTPAGVGALEKGQHLSLSLTGLKATNIKVV